MTAPWIAAFACLWLLVLGLAAVVIGVLRQLAATLQALPSGSEGSARRNGPTLGASLPALEVHRSTGEAVVLSDIDGPYVMAVLSSGCAPCLTITEWLCTDDAKLNNLASLVVLSDASGDEQLDLGESVRVLVDTDRRAIRGLEVPGTPFAIEIASDGRVASANPLSGPDHLARLLDAGPSWKTGSAVEDLTISHVGGLTRLDAIDVRHPTAK